MKQNFKTYYNNTIKNFFEAVGNIFIFLPYFFSVSRLLKTLFEPWKNITVQKTERGFSFSDFFNRLSYNAVSRGMGFVMRISILMFYVILQVVYFLSLLIIVPLFIISTPALYLLSQMDSDQAEKKAVSKQRFIQSHLLEQSNLQYVDRWYEKLYHKKFLQSQWWKLNNLFTLPPLGRDWAVGYTPFLDEFAEELTSSQYQSKIKNIVGRRNEIGFIEQALSKSEEANVLVVGEEGVGKHAVIDAFAKRVYEGKTNNLLAYKRVLKINMEKILTQYVDQKQREEFFENLLQEAANAKNIILIIENIDKYVNYGDGRLDLSESLEKFGKGSLVQIVGLTSPFFYQKYIASNDKLSRIFAKLDVFEVSRTEAVEILLDTAPFLEFRYNVVIPFETILNTIDKSDFFITNLPFPEKSVQLLDTSCVYTTQTLYSNVVTPEIVNIVLAEKTHVPVSLSTQMKEKLLHIEALLLHSIVNQNPAVNEIASALRRAFLLIGKRKKPLASFLFLGPTGVGKTETAKAITKVFFSSEKNLLRFDMSNYQSKEDISKLIGSMDSQNPGLLTESIRNTPYGVLLLDELEKANKDMLNIFLTILDEGYFTDGFGKHVDCKNLIIVATSNAGASELFQQNKSGDTTQFNIMNYLIEKHIFSAEFLNRFDGIITFNNLDKSSALIIARAQLKTVEDQILSLYKVKVQVADNTLQSLIETNYDPQFGARNLERVLRQNLEDKVAKIILEGKAKEGDTITL